MSSMRTSRVAACLLALVLAVATAAPAASAQTHVGPSQTHV
jgi:hypothetical protein